MTQSLFLLRFAGNWPRARFWDHVVFSAGDSGPCGVSLERKWFCVEVSHFAFCNEHAYVVLSEADKIRLAKTHTICFVC